MRNVTAEDSHVAGVGIAHFRDCVPALKRRGRRQAGPEGKHEGRVVASRGRDVARAGERKRERARNGRRMFC